MPAGQQADQVGGQAGELRCRASAGIEQEIPDRLGFRQGVRDEMPAVILPHYVHDEVIAA